MLNTIFLLREVGNIRFSLLADCFAARLSGTLCEVEAVVAQVEQARSLCSVGRKTLPTLQCNKAL